MFARSTFGQPQTSGFGGFQNQPTTTPFGQNQLFGNTTNTFGTTNAFGTNTTPMFGQTQSSAPLFGSTNTAPAFGQPTTGFGAPLFGQQPQQSTSGLFGSTSTFGQQNKPAGFGFGSTTTTGLFGQPQQQQSSSLFQAPATSNVFGGSAFGSNMQTGLTGTVVKFAPVTGTDSMQRSGIAQTISTKHHCITIMKEYEGKSFEELRWEDYQAGRKGPQQQSGFGAPQPFGATASSAPSLFGQPADQNKTVFGSPGFGQPSGFGQTTTQNIFGKPSTGFGTTVTTASSFGFGNTASTNLFGTSTAAKPFGTQPTTNLFGQPAQQPQQQQQPAFGTNLFGQTNTQQQNTNNLFGKPAQPAFGQSTGFQFGQPAATQSSGLFNTPKSTPGFGFSFGQTSTSTTPFGQAQPQQQQSFGGFNSSFGKPTFGQPQQQTTGFGTGLGMTGGSLFGNTAPKPGGLFGNTQGTGLFSSTFQPNTGFGMPQQTQPQQQQLNLSTAEQNNEDLQKFITHYDTYGNNPALAGLEPIKPREGHYVTNPVEIKELLESPPPQRITPHAPKINVLPPKIRSYDILDDPQEETSDSSFYTKTGTRRLIIRKKPDPSEDKLSTLVQSFISQQNQNNGSLIEDESSKVNNTSDTGSKVISDSLINSPKSSPLKKVLFAREKTSGEEENTEKYEDAVDDPKILRNLDRKKSHSKENNSREQSPQNILRIDEEKEDTETEVQGTYGYSKSPNVLPKKNQSTQLDSSLQEDKTTNTDKSCGVILTRKGYYIIPPLNRLDEYKNEQGRCIISGLTVGRLGYGNVYFPNEVDVTGMNLDELVHFTYRTITIFPDDSNKHPLGTGLNQAAQVTLDNVFPKNKRSGEDIINPSGSELEEFLEKLHNMAKKLDAEFNDYRSETGSWVFNVSHFSKYTFLDNDVEPSEKGEVEQQKMNNDKKELHKKNTEVEDLQKKTEDMYALDGENETSLSDRSSTVKHNLMESSLFDIDPRLKKGARFSYTDEMVVSDEDEYEKSAEHELPRHRLPGSSMESMFIMKNTLFKESISKPLSSEMVIDDEEDIPADIYIDEPYLYIKSIKCYKLCNLSTGYVPPQKSILTGRNYLDIGVFKNKSAKIGFIGGDKFFASPFNNLIGTAVETPVSNYDMRSLYYCGLHEKNNHQVFNESILVEHLKIVWTYSEITQEKDVPLVTVGKGRGALVEHCTHAETYPKTKQGAYYKSIWDLMNAFWGLKNKSEKKERFSNWLEFYVDDEVQRDFILNAKREEDVFNNIFVLLTGHKIEKAAKVAFDNNMPQLCMLISSINSNKRTSAYLQKQVYQWIKCMAADTITTNVMKIYSILAGITNIETVNVCDNLDWKRALAMHLWYMAPSNKTISYVMQYYEKAFTDFAYARAPNPNYQKSQGKYFDLLYHLMLLSINKNKSLETVLNTSTHTDDLTDYSLSWFLLVTFEALELGTIAEDSRNHTHLNFASQLEGMGLYKWAIFVLSFIKDPIVRKDRIMAVLYRNISINGESDNIEDELVLELKVSPLWIHHIKANKCLAAKMYWQASFHLCITQRYAECHDIVIQHLIPTLMANEQFQEMKHILYPIASGAEKIPNWQKQGGLILDFLQLQELVSATSEQSYKERYLEVNEEIVSIIKRFSDFPTNTPELTLCISEMSRKSIHLLSKLFQRMSPEYSFLSEQSKFHIGDLSMPSDFKLELVLTVLKKHLQEKCV